MTSVKDLDFQKIGRPDIYAGELGKWPEWSFVARAYFCGLEVVTRQDLRRIEGSDKPLVLSEMSPDFRKKAEALWVLLSPLLRGKALAVLRRVEEANGFEGWRQICVALGDSKVGSAGQLDRILHPSFSANVVNLADELVQWDLLVGMYNNAHPFEEVADDVLASTLIRGMPEPLRVQLQTMPEAGYNTIRAAIDSYIRSKQAWQDVPNSTSASSTALSGNGTPMDVDAVTWIGKGKGKAKGRGKGREKGKTDATGFQSTNRTGKGTGGFSAPPWEQQSSGTETWESDVPQCWLCGGWGHKARQCANNRTRQLDGSSSHQSSDKMQVCEVAASTSDHFAPTVSTLSPPIVSQRQPGVTRGTDDRAQSAQLVDKACGTNRKRDLATAKETALTSSPWIF